MTEKFEPGNSYRNPRNVALDQGYVRKDETKQVGGTHYAADYQHWDFVADCGLGYFEGNATKYVLRWRQKNGVEDLRKARTYISKMLDLFRAGKYVNTGSDNAAFFDLMIRAYPHKVGVLEMAIMENCIIWRDSNDLLAILAAMDDLIKGAT